MSRKTDYEILPIFVNRWSPRSLDKTTITNDELNRLFEAARWAPSSYNSQPWRFLYATRDDEHWNDFLNLLVDANKVWAQNAGALIVILSRTTFSTGGKYSPTHMFDTGSAWENMALQATEMNLVTHGMAGFDAQKARKTLNVPEEFEIPAMVAVGRKDTPEKLPEQLQEVETPSPRLPVEKLSTNGVFCSTLTEE